MYKKLRSCAATALVAAALTAGSGMYAPAPVGATVMPQPDECRDGMSAFIFMMRLHCYDTGCKCWFGAPPSTT